MFKIELHRKHKSPIYSILNLLCMPKGLFNEPSDVIPHEESQDT